MELKTIPTLPVDLSQYKNIVIVLGGGGAKGAFQAGALQALMDMGVHPGGLLGVSTGALNASMVATGKGDQLIPVWRDVSPGMVLEKRGKIRQGWRYLLHKAGIRRTWQGWYSNAPLLKSLEKHLGPTVEIPFGVGVVSLSCGEYMLKSGEIGTSSAKMRLPVLASTAIPGIFDPVEIGGHVFVDGGVRNNTPIGDVLKFFSPDAIIIIPCQRYTGAFKWPKEGPYNDIPSIVMRSFEIMMESMFVEDIKHAVTVNRIVKKSSGAYVYDGEAQHNRLRYVPMYLIEPEESLGNALNFEPEQARANIKIGLKAVIKRLE